MHIGIMDVQPIVIAKSDVEEKGVWEACMDADESIGGLADLKLVHWTFLDCHDINMVTVG